MDDERVEPIPYGNLKLFSFIIGLAAICAPLIWFKLYAIMTLAIIVAFTSVRLRHERGWTHWLREWYYLCFNGQYAVFFGDDKSLECRYEPYFTPKDAPGGRGYAYRGCVSIWVRVSGWRLSSKAFVSIGNQRVGDAWWTVDDIVFQYGQRFNRFAHTDVNLTVGQKSGHMTVTIGQALRLITELTVVDEKDNWSIKAVRQFSGILLGKEVKEAASSA